MRALVFLCSLLLLTAAGCNSGECQYNGDCPSGQTCIAKKCVAPPSPDHCPGGQPECSSSETCTSLVCNEGCCKPPCNGPGDCNVDEVCDNGACKPMEAPTGCQRNADCMAPTPYCLTASNTCVECRSTSDCGLGTNRTCSAEMHTCGYAQGACGSDADCAGIPSIPKCDTEQHLCVGCLSPSDCAAGQTCSELQTCVQGPPAHCTQESDCVGNLQGLVHCAVEKNLCVRCVSNNQCSSSQACRQNTCAPQGECLRDSDCMYSSHGPYCNPDTGACVGCLDASGCTTGQACVNHTCGHCTTNADCELSSAGPACDTTRGLCVQCDEDTDCRRPGATCNLDSTVGAVHSCMGGTCRNDGDCANDSIDGSYCIDGTCKQCRSNDQCSGALSCFRNRCQIPTCDSDADCTTSLTGPHCDVNDHTCYPCALDSQCPRTLICDVATNHQCKQLVCNTDMDCARDVLGPYCDTQTKVCVECARNSDCPTGQECVAGTCGEHTACTTNADCGMSALCVPMPVNNYSGWTTRCVPPATTGNVQGGGACSENRNCASGQCYHVIGNTADGICLDACTPTATGGCATGVSTCPADGVTVTLPGPDGVLNYSSPNDDVTGIVHTCWSSSCTTDRDCASRGYGNAPRVCGLLPNPRDPSLAPAMSCLPITGYVQGGMPCWDSSDCQSNLCVAWHEASGRTSGRCFGACLTPSETNPAPSGECPTIPHATAYCRQVEVKVGTATLQQNSCIFHP